MEEERKDGPTAESATVAKDEKREEKQPVVCGKRGCDFGRILIGAMVILFGFTLLAKASGIFPEDMDFDFFRFWPLLIVALGLSLLDTRSRFYNAIGFIVLILVTILLAMSLRGATREAGGYFPLRGEKTPIDAPHFYATGTYAL